MHNHDYDFIKVVAEDRLRRAADQRVVAAARASRSAQRRWRGLVPLARPDGRRGRAGSKDLTESSNKMETDAWARHRMMTMATAMLEGAWELIEPNLSRLTDDDFFWEPQPGAWGVRRATEVRTPDSWGHGAWRVEVDFDDPSPPMTTIGWRLLHAYDCFVDYAGQALGDPARDWNDIEVPGSAAAATEMLAEAVRNVLTRLRNCDDHILRSGSTDTRPRWVLLDKALVELISHAAEIGVLANMRCLTAKQV